MFLFGFFVVFFFFLIALSVSGETNKKMGSARVVKIDDISYLGCKRYTERVVYPFKFSTKKIKSEIRTYLNRKKGFCGYTIFAYLKGMDTNSVAYVIGEFKRSTGKINIRVQEFAKEIMNLK